MTRSGHSSKNCKDQTKLLVSSEMARPGQKNRATFIAFIAWFFILFIVLAMVSKYVVDPNPLIHKELWLDISLFSSFFRNSKIGLVDGNSEGSTPLVGIPDEQNRGTDANLGILSKVEPPSVASASEPTGVFGENDAEEGRLGEQKEIQFEKQSEEGVPVLKQMAEESPNANSVIGINVADKDDIDKSKCNIFLGRWVQADSYPLYPPRSCPYVDEGFNCQDNGRPDSDYLKWRWQPNDCEFPRFNATDFLERLRGKRLMFVGDSMNRNQFESMLCLLHEALSDKSRMFETRGYRITKGRGYYIFKFMDYDCTVEFCRSHFLVREGKAIRPTGKVRPTLMIDRIDKTAPRWKRANILIFNTGHWWTHGKTAKGKDYYQEGETVHEHLDVSTAFRRAMTTWGKWVDENLNAANACVFYRGYSSAHFRGGQWNSGGKCTGETQPILNETFLGTYPSKMQIVEDVIQQMQTRVVLLNVTSLTDFRKDAHPSVYGKHFTEVETKKFIKYQDCSHWCLPGVPDAWNELIYASLVMEKKWSKN